MSRLAMTEHFSLSFENIIWKQALDEANQLLVIECRNGETYQTDFHSIDLKEGKLLANHEPSEETWWTGLETVFDKRILLHGYVDEQTPVHSGIYCYEAETFAPLWQREDLSFSELKNGQIQAKDEEGEIHQLSWDGNEGTNTSFPSAPSRLSFPRQYLPESPHFETVATFIKGSQDLDISAGAEYLEHKGLIFISYYLCTGEKTLDNYLLILDQNGDICFQDLIGSELPGIGLDTFYLFDDLVLFVKEKNTLVALKC